MLVATYSGGDDLMVFKVDGDGNHIGCEEYFGPEIGRNMEDYDITICELPLLITSSIKVEPERVHQ